MQNTKVGCRGIDLQGAQIFSFFRVKGEQGDNIWVGVVIGSPYILDMELARNARICC